MTTSITDFGQFTSLRASADRNDPEALREVASQFEALFVQSLLKNMRGAELAEPMFGGSEQNKMYQGMLDQQLSLEMASGRGIGLADMLVRQMGGEVADIPVTRELHLGPVRATRRMDGAQALVPAWSSPDAFVRDAWPHAERAARRLNVAPQALLAQAALETGWGEHVMQGHDGANSYNLFGIKAGAGWRGDSVTRPTIEYEGGVANHTLAKFRAYPDIAATFDDYAELIDSHPRYRAVRGHGENVEAFAAALQDAGYATDPHYADKISGVLNGETMRHAIGQLKIASGQPIAMHAAAADR
jgi:flagellar protein FlgJ